MTDHPTNAQQAAYWNDIGGPHWVDEQHQFDLLLAGFGAEALRVLDAQRGEHVLDIGCGTGTSTLAIAASVGPTGSVVGCDISSTMIDAARTRAATHPQVSLAIADAQADDLLQADPFDAVHSRFGVMFFADPVAAFTNIARAVRPAGRLVFVCWQSEDDNPWVGIPSQILRSFMPDVVIPPPNAPGPFAFADADRIYRILGDAGWTDVEAASFTAPTVMGGGNGVDAAVAQAMSNRVGQALREQVDEKTLAAATDAVRAALAEHLDDDGAVRFIGSVWIVTASRL